MISSEEAITAGCPNNASIFRRSSSADPSSFMSCREDLNWSLMRNNIQQTDVDALVNFLQPEVPILTQASQVEAFEQEWSRWLGVEHSVFVNSGSSANLMTITALKETYGAGEIIVPTLTWVSDIASVIQCGLKPVFVDIDRRTLGMDTKQVLKKITPQTKAVFLTHVLGYNALDANFSFYYAHHMSTIEGGMICTNDGQFYEALRMLRSHGMVRESKSVELRNSYRERHPDLNPDFIFAFPGYNVRSTEINAVIGRSQLKRLNDNNNLRTENLRVFLDHLDGNKYQTDFAIEGSCNYALTLVLKEANPAFCERVMSTLRRLGVEFRRGTSGGGNQLRQPYAKRIFGDTEFEKYPVVNHVHFYGFYIGNYPGLEKEKILQLCKALNALPMSEATDG